MTAAAANKTAMDFYDYDCIFLQEELTTTKYYHNSLQQNRTV